MVAISHKIFEGVDADDHTAPRMERVQPQERVTQVCKVTVRSVRKK